ncbi:zinc knuckle CX2CX4HX4C containing protein [Tanacetum coccineum]
MKRIWSHLSQSSYDAIWGGVQTKVKPQQGVVQWANHALVLEVARGFNYVNSGSDTSSEELIRVTPGTARGLTPEPSKTKANFRLLSSENLYKGVDCSIPRKVVEMMIRNSPIILKKWSMNTHLCKEELIRILVWVKIHDVPIQVFSEDGLSIISSQIESLTMGVPLIDGLGFTTETVNIKYEWKPPHCDLLSTLLKNQPHKANVPRTKDDIIIMSNSYAIVDDESEEEIENVYDESANLLISTKIGGSSSTFTVAAG